MLAIFLQAFNCRLKIFNANETNVSMKFYSLKAIVFICSTGQETLRRLIFGLL